MEKENVKRNIPLTWEDIKRIGELFEEVKNDFCDNPKIFNLPEVTPENFQQAFCKEILRRFNTADKVYAYFAFGEGIAEEADDLDFFSETASDKDDLEQLQQAVRRFDKKASQDGECHAFAFETEKEKQAFINGLYYGRGWEKIHMLDESVALQTKTFKKARKQPTNIE